MDSIMYLLVDLIMHKFPIVVYMSNLILKTHVFTSFYIKKYGGESNGGDDIKYGGLKRFKTRSICLPSY